MAANRKGRTVQDLYNATEMIAQPKITSVLEGSYRMQGPMDEIELDVTTNMVPSAGKRLAKCMRQKFHTRAESGTCNVCSTPCSSCMHLKLAHMGSKGEEFSDETCRVTATSQYSNNDSDALSSLKNRACGSLQHTTSEASNLLSVNSSHDSLCENAESKANMRFDMPDTLIESEIHPKLPSGGTLAEYQHSPKLECIMDQRAVSSKLEDSKIAESLDDNISCVSRANDVRMMVNYHNKNLEKKNLSCSSPSVCSSVLERSGKVIFSHNSDLLGSLNDIDGGNSSPKVWNNCPPATASGDLHDNGKLVACPMEHMNPSLSKEASSTIVSGNNCATDNSADSSPNGKITLSADAFKGSNKICPKLDLKTGKGVGDEMDEGFKCSAKVGNDEGSNELVELPNVQEHPLPSVSGDESDQSEILEHDVKVCDICGDAGREDLLAICSRCTDGAEHTYCMREMLQKVPEGEWLCEECKIAEENENPKQGSNTEEKRLNKASTQSFGKRHAETIEVASASKRQAIETSLGSPRLPSSPSRTVALSRDSSFKNLDKGKVKQVHQTSLGNHSGIDFSEVARSFTGPRLQNPKGTLLKSNSFSTINSKPKVKLVDGVPQKHKGARESSSLDVKEGPARMISKSMSFKTINLGHSSSSDSKIKMLSTKFPHVQDTRGLKQLKDQNAFERKNLSKLDRPLGASVMTGSGVSTPRADQKLTPRGESVMVSSTSNNNRESKAGQSDGKLGTLSRSTSSIGRKVTEIPAASVRASSINGMSSAPIEQKFSQVSPKEEPCSSLSWTADKLCRNATETLQDGLPRSRESSNQDEKSREISVTSLRPAGINGPKNVTSQKCKETSHSAEVHEGQANLGPCSSDTYKQTSFNNVKQLNVRSADASVKVEDSDHILPSVSEPSHAPETMSVLKKMSAIPEHDYVWQGDLEVRRAGKLGDFYCGIQAHLSTCASPKVHDVVNKFPQKITLDEVPRLSTWPKQFNNGGAQEDNIALYFFAKDLESYTKDYKGLVDDMIKKDLALKGSFDSVELFIFPSIQLPENSQRWNTLFFLWGVFRGKRSDCTDSVKKLTIPSLNTVPQDKGIPSALVSSPERIGKEKSASDSSCDVDIVSNIPEGPYNSSNGNLDKKAASLQTNSERQGGGLDSKSLSKVPSRSALLCPESTCAGSSPEEATLQECRVDSELKPSAQSSGASSGPNGKDTQMRRDFSDLGEEASLLNIFNVGSQGLGVRDSISDEKIVDRTYSDRDEVEVDRDLNEDNMNVDGETSLDRGSRKWPYLDLSKTVPLISSSASQKMLWNMVDSMSIGGESIRKKLKTGFSGLHGGSGLRDGNSLNAGFASQCDLGSGSSVDEEGCENASDEKIIMEDVGATERYFFPVDSQRVQDFRLGSNSIAWKGHSSNDEHRFLDSIPNLELALGAETKSPNKGILPFFVGMVEKNNKQNKAPDEVTDEGEEDGVSSSLSLSLSFPFPEKEQTVKPVSKTEQFVPERHHVNTSLLLFGGLSDK